MRIRIRQLFRSEKKPEALQGPKAAQKSIGELEKERNSLLKRMKDEIEKRPVI